MIHNMLALLTITSLFTFAAPATPVKDPSAAGPASCYRDTQCLVRLGGSGVDGSTDQCKQAGGKSFKLARPAGKAPGGVSS